MASRTANQTVHFSQAALITPVLAYFENVGIPIDKYLAQADISQGLVLDPATPIPRPLIFRFINAVCLGEGIEDIGLLVGQTASLQLMGEFGELLLGASSISEYLERGCRFISTASSGDFYWLMPAEREGYTCFCASVSGMSEDDAVQNYLYVLFITINTIRGAVGSTWCPTALTIPAITSQTAVRLVEALPGTTIIREGKHASFPIPDSLLARPMGTTGSPAEAGKTTLPVDFQMSIAQLAETLIIAGHWDLQSAADIAGISPRTLQRKLADCGTSYTEEVVRTRIRLATRWIRDFDRPLSDIARALGYVDPANFSRAFRRITGLSPRAYRNQLAADTLDEIESGT